MKKPEDLNQYLIDENVSDPVQRTALVKMRTAFSEQGHSGGSAGIVISWLKQYAKKPFDHAHDPDSLLKPFVTTLETLPAEVQHDTLKKFILLVSHKPLTPLTGADDEWVFHKYSADDEGHYQNKRCGSVFKDADGNAYDIDGAINYEPCYAFQSWIGYNGPRVPVTFPYTIPENPIRIYYVDKGRTQTLSSELDPDKWLAMQFERWCMGINPETGLLSPSVLVKDPALDLVVSATLLNLRSQFSEFRKGEKLSVEHWRYLLRELHYAVDSDLPITDVRIDPDQRGHVIRVENREIRPLLRRLVLDKDNWVGEPLLPRSDWYDIQLVPVLVPTEHYQGWSPLKDTFIYRWVHTNGKPEDQWQYCDHAGTHGELRSLDYTDYDDFLYQKRREYGYAHPKRATRHSCAAPACVEENEDTPPVYSTPEQLIELRDQVKIQFLQKWLAGCELPADIAERYDAAIEQLVGVLVPCLPATLEDNTLVVMAEDVGHRLVLQVDPETKDLLGDLEKLVNEWRSTDPV